ncbi:MAG TPA: hypothetical protein DCZ71_07040 [Ruminococcus sp.]|nr:hypothetical protein [Ruminococcus sp.]
MYPAAFPEQNICSRPDAPVIQDAGNTSYGRAAATDPLHYVIIHIKKSLLRISGGDFFCCPETAVCIISQQAGAVCQPPGMRYTIPAQDNKGLTET